MLPNHHPQVNWEWSDDGCELIGYDTLNVTCSCSHLTDFAVATNMSAGYAEAVYVSPKPTPVPTPFPSPLPTYVAARPPVAAIPPS